MRTKRSRQHADLLTRVHQLSDCRAQVLIDLLQDPNMPRIEIDVLTPHFHVERADESAEIGIDPIIILEGSLTRSTRDKVFEWAAIHQAELRANWELARAGLPLLAIAPLD